MSSSVQPLLKLPASRIHDELRRAALQVADAAVYRRKRVRLTLVCINDYLIGCAFVALSLHMSNGDLARVLFCLGLLRALCMPMWTVILSLWLEANE